MALGDTVASERPDEHKSGERSPRDVPTNEVSRNEVPRGEIKQPEEVSRSGRAAPLSPQHAEDAARRRRRNWIIGGAILLLVLLAALAYLVHWYVTGRYFVSTDDAYSQADNVTISPQITGYIDQLWVTDNQRVHAGDLILRIDPRSYTAQFEQSQADLTAAAANLHNAEAQLILQGAVIAQAVADLASAQAQLAFAEQEMARYGKLVVSGAGTVQRAQQAEATLRSQRAAIAKAEAIRDTEQQRIAVLETQKEQAQASLQRAEAALSQARINLGYTEIHAPIEGVVGDRGARLGQYVQPGTRLLTIVPTQDVYVVANYKETQLARMHRGQPVDLSFDAYPGAIVRGRLDSLAPGTGAQFALLPPENATGNFTKIVQRVPVKILIERDDVLAGRLRPGLSVTPTVDTSDTRGERLEERPAPDATAGATPNGR